MEGKEGVDPAGAEFTSDSSWTFTGGPDSVSVDSVNYFFDRESSILSEFGWNIRPDHGEEIERFDELNRTDDICRPDLAGNFSGSQSQSCCATAPAADAVVVGCGSGSGTASNLGVSADVLSSNPSVSSSSSEDPPEKSTGSGGTPPEIP